MAVGTGDDDVQVAVIGDRHFDVVVSHVVPMLHDAVAVAVASSVELLYKKKFLDPRAIGYGVVPELAFATGIFVGVVISEVVMGCTVSHVTIVLQVPCPAGMLQFVAVMLPVGHAFTTTFTVEVASGVPAL